MAQGEGRRPWRQFLRGMADREIGDIYPNSRVHSSVLNFFSLFGNFSSKFSLFDSKRRIFLYSSNSRDYVSNDRNNATSVQILSFFSHSLAMLCENVLFLGNKRKKCHFVYPGFFVLVGLGVRVD